MFELFGAVCIGGAVCFISGAVVVEPRRRGAGLDRRGGEDELLFAVERNCASRFRAFGAMPASGSEY